MAILVFRRSGGFREYFTLAGTPLVVGRAEECDIVLDDPSVSRRHARIEPCAEGWRLADLGSKNGTRIGGRPVGEAVLRQGDPVHFGDVHALYFDSPTHELSLDPPASEETVLVGHEDLSREAKQLRVLYDLADLAATCDAEGALVARALELLCRELSCENIYLGLHDPAARRIARAYFRSDNDNPGRAFAVSRTILDRAIRERGGLLVTDVRTHKDLQDVESIVRAGARSILCAPMMVSGEIVGVLYADTRSTPRPFARQDLVFLAAAGSLLGSMIRNLQALADLRRRNQELHRRIEGLDLVGESLKMAVVRESIQRFATRGDAPVLITGESGTGKELAARLVHRLSARGAGPFLDVNCAAIPAELMESELFGHVRGAFTSASRDRRGLFQMADGGTLFLDEIGEMTLELQGKLLRVLETGEFRPVGAEKAMRADVRIVAATNRDLAAAATCGEFRRDLFFRLHVLTVAMPALREHPEDIPALAGHFLALLRSRVATRVERLSPAALEVLARHTWPGNVRELKNGIERALYLCDGEEILPEHLVGLGGEEALSAEEEENDGPLPAAGPLDREVEALESTRIWAALERHRWNRSRAAAELGIARKTLLAKMKRYGLG